jgi:hypothetical protein
MYYVMPDPNQNWGLNPNSGVRYEVLVPRPPRPATAYVAIVLTYISVAVALIYCAINSIEQWNNRDAYLTDLQQSSRNTGIDMTSLMRNSLGGALIFTAVLWILVGAALVICAVTASRGNNGSRIALAAAMGVLGLYQLCGAVSAGLSTSLASQAQDAPDNSPFAGFTALSKDIHWWSYVGPSLLSVIAISIFVLLLVPPTNRYFSAGAGRRFAPKV